MKRIEEGLRVMYEKVVYHDWDVVGIVSGNEGSGKSNLSLHLKDLWDGWLFEDGHLEKLNPKKRIKFIGLSMDQFLRGFQDLQRFNSLIYDEAGELSSLRMMNKFNYKVTKTYEVVRGANLFSLLVLPDVFYLNPFFSARRAKFYIHVYKRGSFAFWDQERLQHMIEINKSFKRKNPFRVKPLFYDNFPKYKGDLLKPYLEKKEEKINRIRRELHDELMTEDSDKYLILQAIYNLHENNGKKLNTKLIASAFNMSERSIFNRKNEWRKLQKLRGGPSA